MRIAHLIIGFGLLALVLSGCATRQAAGVLAGSELENDFELVLYRGADVLGGESIQFSKVLAQGKPVVLIMSLLEAAGADYGDEVLIVGLHRGYRSVPTIVFPDGSILVEPLQSELERKLKALG
jgi:hypothetical protein